MIRNFLKLNGLAQFIILSVSAIVFSGSIAYFDPRDRSYDLSELLAKSELLVEEKKQDISMDLHMVSHEAVKEHVLVDVEKVLQNKVKLPHYDPNKKQAGIKIAGVGQYMRKLAYDSHDKKPLLRDNAFDGRQRSEYIQNKDITLISDSIHEDTIWHVGRTYLITQDITVMNAELTIMPGAVVLFEKDTSLIIGHGARLFARGHLSLPIVFAKASYDGNEYKSGYYNTAIHIKAESLPGSVIENTRISSAASGIKVERTVQGPIRNCIIEHCRSEIENLIH